MVVWLGGCTAFAAVAFAPFWVDRAIVWAMRTCRIYAFPEAIRLAVSLERDAAQWQTDTHKWTHPIIGRLYYPDTVGILHLKIGDTAVEWKPNWIERRIICNAARQVVRRDIHRHLNKTLP
jgi:hypothetical protein